MVSLSFIWLHKSHLPPFLNFVQCHEPHFILARLEAEGLNEFGFVWLVWADGTDVRISTRPGDSGTDLIRSPPLLLDTFWKLFEFGRCSTLIVSFLELWMKSVAKFCVSTESSFCCGWNDGGTGGDGRRRVDTGRGCNTGIYIYIYTKFIYTPPIFGGSGWPPIIWAPPPSWGCFWH